MDLVIGRRGEVRCIYDDLLDLHCLGTPHIVRASHVEPDPEGRWWADLSPISGPRIGPFNRRTEALEAELAWLESYWLAGAPTLQ